ncbi:MAG: hypothetical protein PGN13_03435 [Patulibacter minatonensis]
MPRSEPRTLRALLLLAVAALTFSRRARMSSGVRLHVQRLQRVTPIHQFATIAGNRALFDRHQLPLDLRIVAQRDHRSGRMLMVPIDERVLAGWLG